MSEEEKKAIEYIKEFRNEVFEGVGNKSTMAKNIDILLKLIDKQQKEIEEKSTIIMAGAEKVKQLEKEIEKLKFSNHMVDKWNEYLDKECISKDKIREKIEEYKEKFNNTNGFVFRQEYLLKVKALKELLEEN